MPATSRVRFFETDPFVGPKLKARKLDKSLLAIKPKNCRIKVSRAKDIERIHGSRVAGIHLSKGTQHTVLISPNVEKETIAHEFAHAALRHRPWVKVSTPEYIKRELNAWRWASEHWAQPNKIKSGILKERKRWIAFVAQQTMFTQDIDLYSALVSTERQMRLLKMEPLTTDEAKWIIKDTKAEEKELRKTGWQPKYSIR